MRFIEYASFSMGHLENWHAYFPRTSFILRYDSTNPMTYIVTDKFTDK